jgi:tRNA(fMet)-specific endonuclease VapC
VYLLDTNICIAFARGTAPALRERVRQHFTEGLAMSAITLAELRVGARASADPEGDAKQLDLLATLIPARDFDGPAAESYGRLVREIGVKRRSFDRLIAAHALSLGLSLVTSNERDFADVPGLRIVNWSV